MANNFNCKKCGAEDTKSFQMLHEQQTSTGSFGGLVSGAGVGIGSNGIGAVGGGGAFSGNMSMATLLAQRIAPPKKREVAASDVGGPLAVLLFISGLFLINLRGLKMAGIICLSIAVLIFIALGVRSVREVKKAKKYNEEIYAPAYKKWQEMHVCLRCGHEFQIKKDFRFQNFDD